MILCHAGGRVWLTTTLRCTIIGKRQEACVQKQKTLFSLIIIIFQRWLFVSRRRLQLFLLSRVLWAWTKNQGFYTIPEARCREYTYYRSSSERESGIHGLIPGRQCPKASCYSHSGNVSAFNGIVNRNAFPRGSEEDWHCCSDCYTPNSEVSHINIPILSQFLY